MTAQISPIHIGPLRLDVPVILAPMSKVTDLAFRRQVKRQGAGMVVSEMIASQAMIRHSRQSLRMARTLPEEHPAAVQLAGCEPEVMAEAARLNEDMGAEIIDINMGCPVKKVVNGHAGSALMKDEARAARILEATVNAVKLPVTLKMRIGWDEKNRNAPALARIAENCGIRMLTVHGRTRSQAFGGRADWDFIGAVKDAVGIPLIANGDIETVDDAAEILRRSGADGVMIGRGVYGRPWFVNQVMRFLCTGERLPDPDLARRYEIVREHYLDMMELYGYERGVPVARKHVSWYSKGLPGGTEFRNRVNRCPDAGAVLDMMREFYEPLIGRMAA